MEADKDPKAKVNPAARHDMPGEEDVVEEQTTGQKEGAKAPFQVRD